MPSSPSTGDPRALLPGILQLADAGRLGEAARACKRLLDAHPGLRQGWELASQIAQRARDFEPMLFAAQRAAALAPGSIEVQLRAVECLLYCGRTREALASLAALERAHGQDVAALIAIGGYYSHCARHLAASHCYERATRLAPDHRIALTSLAAANTTLGDFSEAQAQLRTVVERWPEDCDAWVNLANLRTWTPAENHVARLRELLATAPPAAEAPLCYALFKELEDLGEDAQAFACLERGAAARRRAMRYRVERDIEIMDTIRRVFDAPLMSAARSHGAGREVVFVMGLPRSGTTLVDRILSSHPDVESLGELRDFTFAVMRLAGPGQPGQIPLIERSRSIDFAALGAAYLDAVAPYRGTAARFIDKTPANYLYAGLLRLALPEARLILLRRNPLDTCYAMFKTLFQAGYPFSYDLEDLARYYVAWERLIAHWHTVAPGAILEIEYESLVADQTRATRRLLEHCGLGWHERCLDFHRNPAPAATASASQVRKPLYRTSLGRWRRVASGLAPLSARLREAGIDID